MASNFAYESLHSTPDVIRLLEVDLSGSNQHKLVRQANMRSTKYLALSYTWGTSSNQVNTSLNFQQFLINTNLSKALESVRQHWIRHYPRRDVLLLWVDQICINQKDEVEKGHQVSMMGDIYRCAHQTLVWLPVPASVAGGFQDWQTWRSWHQNQLTTSQAIVTQGPVAQTEMAYGLDADYPVGSDSDSRDRELMMAWNHIHDIIASPWWERAWIYQEIMGPDHATFLIGHVSAPWEELYKLLQLFFSQRHRHGDFCARLVRTLRSQGSGCMIRLPNCCGSCLDECRMCTGESRDAASRSGSDWDGFAPEIWRAVARRHSERLLEAEALWKPTNFVLQSKKELQERKKSVPVPYLSLLQLMGHSRNCKASVPLDKVYAFLGLAEPGHGIQVDYSKTANSVLAEVARAIILKQERLDILEIAMQNDRSRVQSPTDQLPSWVPDWSVKDDADTEYKTFLEDIRYDSMNYSLGASRASQIRKAVASFHADSYGRPHRILRARGILADCLMRAKPNATTSSFSHFVGESGAEIKTILNARIGDEVWVLLGCNDPFTLRKDGGLYTILGHAMVLERNPMFEDVLSGTLNERVQAAREAQHIRDGGLIERLERGEAATTDIMIS
ncbi:unnamed protein product [Clonostachys byssicola]|uniref:Heterokaryon incompatibility domain-containing protein n=1 Tax=Clonostachys byssicola TaxID=160290 RepID=A0A9N9Y1R1_9HYPO|nr:unnamed protein product [Clonostachys byssicola]